MLISRSDRGLLANWWFSVDKVLLSAVLLLMAAGVLLSLAASPPVAQRLDLPYLHFFKRQLIFLVPAVAVLVGVSFFDLKQARRTAFWCFVAGLGLMGLALVIGPEIKGAHRWISLGSFSLQPSEFVKPAFVVSAAWLMAEGRRRPDMPGQMLAWGLFFAFVGMLLIQPDFGQTVLVCLVWTVMLLVNGLPWLVFAGLAGIAAFGAVTAYNTMPHVASRVERFLHPENADTFQVDTATRAFENGGLFGTGPGGGTAKLILPDSHTDFIFAVAGEEFGYIAILVLIGLVAFIALRVLNHAARQSDGFSALAASGLVSIFAFQAIINMAVNVSLMPAKGMTLPFISYGGSSLLAMSFAMGLVLAFSRARPRGVLPGGGLQPGFA